MSEITQQTALHPSPQEWSFSSGRAAVLESRMLPRAFFERLAQAERLEDALYALSESPLADSFGHVDDLREADQRVRARYDALIAEMRLLSPDPTVAGLLDVQRQFRSLKSYIKRVHLGLDVPPVDCSYDEQQWHRLWDDLPNELPPWFGEALEQARRTVGAGDAEDQDQAQRSRGAVMLDAAFDSATLVALRRAARATGSPFVTRYYRRYDTAMGVEMLWRARVLEMDEQTQAVYAQGRAEPELFDAMWRLPEDDWPALVAAWVDGIEPETLMAAAPLERMRLYVRAADAWLMAFARDAKRVVFGPERVFGCVIGLEAEAYNAALVIAGRVNDVAADVLKHLLRTPYV